ncbi:hypothetical protein FM020_12030 [Acinetobacter tandoii]|nr:hypothetical protein FM020_12030 [Acinetobacter tandoii]
MSEILAKQNLDVNLNLLAAQRYINTDIKLKRSIVRIFSLAIFLISFSVLYNLINADDTYAVYRELFCFFVAIISFFLLMKGDDSQILAATFQQKFDCNLFGLNFDLSNKDEVKVSEFAHKYNTKIGNLERIEGWYTSAIGDKAFPEDIFSCQKQNLMWTKELKRSYVFFLIILNLFILIASIIVSLSFWSESNYSSYKKLYEIIIFYLCYISAFLAPLIKHVLDLYKIKKSIFLYCEIHDLFRFSQARKLNMALIEKIQNHIFDYRKSNLSVPDYFADGRKFILEAKSKLWVKN